MVAYKEPTSRGRSKQGSVGTDFHDFTAGNLTVNYDNLRFIPRDSINEGVKGRDRGSQTTGTTSGTTRT